MIAESQPYPTGVDEPCFWCSSHSIALPCLGRSLLSGGFGFWTVIMLVVDVSASSW